MPSAAVVTLAPAPLTLSSAPLARGDTPPPPTPAAYPVFSGGVKNAHMSFIENPTTTAVEQPAHGVDSARKQRGEAQGVTFLYRLVVGQAHRSYGLNVARAAGMDEDMIDLAARKSGEMRDR